MMPAPVAIGLFLCREVEFTSPIVRANVTGEFALLQIDRSPGVAPTFYAYAQLKGSFGSGTVRVCAYRLDLDGLERVYVTERAIIFPDRLEMVHVRIRIEHCTFPVEGEYEFVLMVDQDIVAQKTIYVTTEQIP